MMRLWLFGIPCLAGFVTAMLLTLWGQAHHRAVGQDLPLAPVDVIIVLGAGDYRDRLIPDQQGRGRVAKGVALHRAGHAPYVMMTGGPGARGAPPSAAIMADYAADLGMPLRVALIEPCARTTLGNAQHAAAIMRRLGMTRAIIVTDAYHMARARLLFAMIDIEVAGWAVSDGAPVFPETAILRETLAHLLNIAKVTGWYVGQVFGRSPR